MSKNDLYTEEALIKDLTKTIVSPCGKYELTIKHFKTGENTWNYTMGEVRTVDGYPIAIVKRNYSIFWYEWIIDHPVTHNDYLLCGEDYQGYTVVNLRKDKRVDYLPKAAKSGVGFCWASAEYIEDGEKGPELHVEGCYWGASYERVIYDFRNPDKLPYPELLWEDI